MSKQLDWIGTPETAPPAFRDIRNTRPSAATRKAELVLELGQLINRCPDSIRSASVNKTREWMAARSVGAKCAGNPRSSVVQLELAIKALRLAAGEQP